MDAKKTRTSLRSTAQINYSEMNRGSHNSPTRGENRSIAVGRKRQPQGMAQEIRTMQPAGVSPRQNFSHGGDAEEEDPEFEQQ